ncbi:arginine--tRNA ligase [Mycoplasma sp. SG1]|uniref:arginine--tRNA ligase n=1 Tax=Mycoplasma sp. SG1 TaxID=2810348 RepID=UPI002025225C|nr:arginine--tRNA ligase [Mycoplasma sp. SG1]URM52831.1 arginine--tRNA ligase [Mycoplasma sp. SG1]
MSIFNFIELFKENIKIKFKISENELKKIHFFFNQNINLSHISTNFIFWYKKANPNIKIEEIEAELKNILSLSIFNKIVIEKTTIQNQFFNIFFADSTLFHFFNKSLDPFQISLTNKSVNIEYVSANPTGPLHLGHLRNGIVGDVLANILKYLNVNITRYFYINDSGNQIQHLGYSIINNFQNKLNLNSYIVDEKIKLYQSAYIDDISKLIVNDPLNKFNKEYFLNNQNITSELIQNFSQKGLNYILEKIKKTLKNFKIDFDQFISEKEMIQKYAKPSLDKLNENNFIYQKNEKVWLKTTKYNDSIDRVLYKEDNSSTYILGDICYHYYRIMKGFNHLINIWGADHHGYVNRITAICKEMGMPLEHLQFGLIQFVSILKNNNEVTKMSKRNKNVINADDLYNHFGADILRFFLISVSTDSHLHINLDLLKIKNNNNLYYYCQYGYLRIISLLKKVPKERLDKIKDLNLDNFILNESERKLLIQAISFFQVLKNCIQNLNPVFLHTHLIKLSKRFHSFYNQEKILNQSDFIYNKKIKIILHLKKHLETCFDLLKIKSLKQL